MSGLRYLLLVATRTRAPVLPAVATLFALAGIFGQPRNLVGSSWALTSLVGAGLAAWSLLVALNAEPPAQADMATAAVGGQAGRLRLAVAGLAATALTLAVLFVAVPLLLEVVLPRQVFARRVHPGDVVAALVTNALGAAVGGAVGVLCAPPRVLRRATGAAAALAGLLALVAVAPPLGNLGGPVAAASALTDAAPGALGGRELLGWLSGVLAVAGILAASRALGRHRG